LGLFGEDVVESGHLVVDEVTVQDDEAEQQNHEDYHNYSQNPGHDYFGEVQFPGVLGPE